MAVLGEFEVERVDHRSERSDQQQRQLEARSVSAHRHIVHDLDEIDNLVYYLANLVV
jgi:hypothetical protein